MPATGAEGHVGITEDLNQSIGYLLLTGQADTYDRETGDIVQRTLEQVVPGITVRPARTTLRGTPTIDLRDDDTLTPYMTWFPRGPIPGVQEAYGGTNKEQSYWEVNVKLGETDLVTQHRIQDWVVALLRGVGEMPIYFWYSISGGTPPVSRGDDIIALGRITDVTAAPHIEVSAARGEEDWIVVNFTVGVWKAEKSIP